MMKPRSLRAWTLTVGCAAAVHCVACDKAGAAPHSKNTKADEKSATASSASKDKSAAGDLPKGVDSDQAIRFELKGKATQGGVVFAQTTPGAKVVYRKRALRVTDDGTFILAFGPNHPEKAYVNIVLPNGAEKKFDISVEQREYITEEIDGLPDEEVDLTGEVRKELAESHREVNAARMRDTAEPYFKSGFEWPAKGPITGVYGSKRLLNGKKASPHWGVDIASRKGASAHSPADGVIAYASKDEDPLAGKVVVIDHGFGLTSSFLHLNRLHVKTGDGVKKGQRVADIGTTGRSTGAHLDWRMNLFDIRVDPETVVERRSNAQKLAEREEAQHEAKKKLEAQKERKEEKAERSAKSRSEHKAKHKHK